MSNVKYIAFDLETGGFDPSRNAILTIYMAAVNEELVIVDEIDLKLKPSDNLTVEEQALAVNGIDLAKHIEDPTTLTYSEARDQLLEFLNKHKGKTKANRPKPLGQNVEFDIDFLKTQLLSRDEWERFFHYSKADTKIISDFLKDCGWLPAEIGSLTSMVAHFGIPMLKAHSAKDDVKMCIEVYRKLKDLMSSRKESQSGYMDSILDILEGGAA